MSDSKKIVQALEHISVKILLIRGEKVMLDRDIEELSGVKTKQKMKLYAEI